MVMGIGGIVDEKRLDEILGNLPPDKAVVVREFASRPPAEQSIYLFRRMESIEETVRHGMESVKNEVAQLRDDRTLRATLIKAAGPIGIVLYALADQLTTPEFWKSMLR